MPLAKRFFFFFIGVFLGSIMVYFIFGDRDFQCNFWPNSRILSELRERELSVEEQPAQFLSLEGKDTTLLHNMLLMGEIDFGRSQTRLDSCNSYHIEFEGYTARVEKCRVKARVVHLQRSR